MKFDPAMIVVILQMILCNGNMLAWLREEAKKTQTPIDDTAVALIEMLLCPKA